jgi:flagellar motor protein MotB
METTPRKKPPKETTTERVLKYIRNPHPPDGEHKHTHAHTEEHEEHEEHVDERWLVSYADMMTLLFGLFVLLYSMSTMDADKLAKIQSSAKKQFGGKTNEQNEESQTAPEKEAERLKLKEEVEKLKAAVKAAETKETALEKQLETLAKESPKKAQTQVQLVAAQKQNKELEKELAEMKMKVTELKKSTDKTQSQNEKLTKVQNQSRELASTNEKLEKSLNKIEAENVKHEKTIQELEAKLAAAVGNAKASSFLAVIIIWPTTNHDIDLVIEDPNGKRFDFKNRKHAQYPGLFSLDTRRGPGAELWQTDQLVPGTYKITYVFYNPYGNKEPCTISGTVYSSKGGVELPAAKLNFDSNNRAAINVKVDQDGSVKVVN